ncbi:unnamed protein product [Rhodiola kirilowii]
MAPKPDNVKGTMLNFVNEDKSDIPISEELTRIKEENTRLRKKLGNLRKLARAGAPKARKGAEASIQERVACSTEECSVKEGEEALYGFNAMFVCI